MVKNANFWTDGPILSESSEFNGVLITAGAKADVGPLCIHPTYLLFLFLTFCVSIFLCGSMGSMWDQQNYIAVLHLHLVYFVSWD